LRGRDIDRRTRAFDPDEFARTDLDPGCGRARDSGNWAELSQPAPATFGFHRAWFGVRELRLGRFDHEFGTGRQSARFTANKLISEIDPGPLAGGFFTVDGPCLRLP
jgi:hypothetical protein